MEHEQDRSSYDLLLSLSRTLQKSNPFFSTES